MGFVRVLAYGNKARLSAIFETCITLISGAEISDRHAVPDPPDPEPQGKL